MIVDDNMANLIMARKALEDTYEIIPVSSGISALECLTDMPDLPDVVLLDVDMPNVNGFQVISEMKTHERLINIPIIFLTAQDDDVTELEGFNLGAADYIKKPFTIDLLKKRIEIQLAFAELTHRNETLNALREGIGKMLLLMLDKKENSVCEHSKRSSRNFAILLQRIMESDREKFKVFDEEDFDILVEASKYFDVGFLNIKLDYIEAGLNPETGSKFGKNVFRTHPKLGVELLKTVAPMLNDNNMFTDYLYNMCKCHHENWDGSGYPKNIKKDMIPLEARILSVASYYDELRYMNTTGKEHSHEEAVRIIKDNSGIMFDPDVVDEFLLVEKSFKKSNP